MHDLHIKPRPDAPLPPTSVEKAAGPSLIKGVKVVDKDAPEVGRCFGLRFINSLFPGATL
jgi:hypothetical protein